MRFLFLSLIFIFWVSNSFANDQFYVTTARNLKKIAEKYLDDGKPDKITIIYNSYNVVIENIGNKESVKDCTDFFHSVFKKNANAFLPLRLTATEPPVVINSTGGWTHKEDPVEIWIQTGVNDELLLENGIK